MSIDNVIEQLKLDERNKFYTERGVGPIFQIYPEAKILLIGQAPGKKVEETGVVFNDLSGENLVSWMGIDMDIFHSEQISVMPMDFYYPGKGKSGDLPPRKFIAREYHPALMKNMQHVQLTILMGVYAQKYYLGDRMKKNLTETVKHFEDYLPAFFPLIHPSPLNNRWQAKHLWFKERVVVALQQRVHEILSQ